MTAIWTALTPLIVHAAADLNAVWVSAQGLQTVPQLVLVWTAIAVGAAALLVVWARRERALRRSIARLRALVR